MLGRGWRGKMQREGNGQRIVRVVGEETVRASGTREKPWLCERNRMLKKD